MNTVTSSKPTLRGYFHQEAFFIGIGACALLISKSSGSAAFLASVVYSFGLLLLLGISALYHRLHWEPRARSIWKRLDHSAIFLLIAGTMTPIGLLALPRSEGHHLLWVIWVTAIFGVLQSCFWVTAPKWITAVFYIIAGWLVLPYLSLIRDSLGGFQLALILVGGIIYTIGAVVYAMKKPNLVPGVFGYHELFHFFTIVAATLHFIVVYRMIR